MEEGAARALKDDEIARRMELLIGNQVWPVLLSDGESPDLVVHALAQELELVDDPP